MGIRGLPGGPRGRGTPRGRVRPLPRGPPWQLSDAHLWLYGVFRPRKNKGKLTRWISSATRRNLGGPNLGLRRSCSAGETSLREGEIITNVITIDPLIRRGSIYINIITSTISSQTLVYLLYPIFILKPPIGTCGLLVVLITPCSWCLLVYLVEDHMFRSLMHIITPLIMNMNVLCQ